jgi:carbonic anhydrase
MSRLTAMIEGYRRFRAKGWARERERWSELAEGQSPQILVIACSDSRVDPATIFDARPGEMFVIRNIAALVPPCQPDAHYHGVSAALEFAVTQLEVKEILVMGHGFCGGCAASLTGQFEGAREGEGHFLAYWLDLLAKARDKVRGEHPELDRAAFQAMEREGVRVSLKNLRTFPWIREREADGRLTLHGAVFAISDGILYLCDETTGSFAPA